MSRPEATLDNLDLNIEIQKAINALTERRPASAIKGKYIIPIQIVNIHTFFI